MSRRGYAVDLAVQRRCYFVSGGLHQRWTNQDPGDYPLHLWVQAHPPDGILRADEGRYRFQWLRDFELIDVHSCFTL